MAVLTLGLAIGANTAIFTVVREMVFSPRPYPDEAQVVQLYTRSTKRPGSFRLFSYPTYTEIRDHSAASTVFSDLLAHTIAMVGLGDDGASRRAFAAVVSSNYFETFGIPLLRGRAFLPEEERPGSAAAVVIASHVYWKKTGFDPGLVGSEIRINERPYTVVGIAPEHFSGASMLFGPELYLPFGCYDQIAHASRVGARRTLEQRDAYELYVVGRLRPGVTASAAAAVLQSVAANLERAYPAQQADQTLLLRPLPRLSISTTPTDEGDLSMLGATLSGLAGMVLLIACLNLANMLLARGLARRREIAIRLAVGGGRARIIRQLVTEGVVLALAGGGVGFLIGLASTDLLAASLAVHMPVALFLRGGADPVVFVATLGFCALATLLFALGPALRLVRADLVSDLKEKGGEDPVGRRHRWVPRNPLVAAQVALSLALLTSAGLFVRAAVEAGSVETGFQADSTLLVEMDASLGGYDEARSLELYRAAGERLSALPGVRSASIASAVPFGLVSINRPVQRAGAGPAPDSRPATAAEGLAFNAHWNGVGADYFATMGLPLLRGRAFTKAEAEMEGTPPVVIVDEVLARRLWPEGDALGQRLQWAAAGAPTEAGGGSGTMGSSTDVGRRDSDPESVEIVGIVPATRWELFERGGGVAYVPFAQDPRSNVFFHVRIASPGAGGESATRERVRQELRAAAPGVPVFAVETFGQHLDSSAQLWLVRTAAATVSLFAAVALALAIVGVYGVMAYAVARRTREIGIRSALGAAPADVLGMVLRSGLVMSVGGAVPGLLVAFGLGRVLSGMLFEVSPSDPVAFTVALAVLAATALLACWLPARRAARVDPVQALRHE
jgi:predicted permease